MKIKTAFFALLFGVPLFAQSPAPLQISSEIAPAGGYAQIKIYAVKPMAISKGHLVLTLDGAAFDSSPAVGLFGANGDASGVATVIWPQIDIQFASPTGGIGQLAGLPVLVVTVPLLSSTGAARQQFTVSATSPDNSLTIASGSVTVQGTLSVSSIPVGMGVVPAGTVLRMIGTGFTPATTVTIDGVAVASTKFATFQQILITLGGPSELIGKRVRVVDNGVEFDHFCFQVGNPENLPENTDIGKEAANMQPLFPLLAGIGAGADNGDFGSATFVENPNATAATVNFINVPRSNPYNIFNQTTLSIPPGSWAIFDGHASTLMALSSDLPVRTVEVNFFPSSNNVLIGVPGAVTLSDPAAPGGPPLVLAPPLLQFAWQTGSSTPPSPQTATVPPVGGSYISAASVASGSSWLRYAFTTNGVTVAPDPTGLAVGTYQGSLLVQQFGGPSTTLPVTLTVTNSVVPTISTAPATLSFTAPSTNAPPYSQTISITSNGAPAPFTVSTLPGQGGGACCFSWLKVSPTSGMTPATITVTWDPSVTTQIPYYAPTTTGSILIAGASNSVAIPATFNVTGVQTYQTSLGYGGLGPNGLVFSAQTGTAAQAQDIFVYPLATMTVTTDQPWLSALPIANSGLQEGKVTATVNPAGLAPGVYKGNVTIMEQGIAPITVPVTLGVWTTPPQLTSTQRSLSFVQAVGEVVPPYQNIEIDSGGVPVPLTYSVGAPWLNLINRFTTTPAPLPVGISRLPAIAGEYDGSFTATSPGSSLYVPVTLLVTPGPAAQPLTSQVVNAASGIPGGISPGEILSIRGYGVGSSAIGGLRLDNNGNVVSQINGLQVTFDGKPAPLIYTSANQTNLIVPYEIAGKTSTVMQVTYMPPSGTTLQTGAWTLPVVLTAPGVFTVDATGTGQGSIVNQDGTVNSVSNPAARGSIVSIYATGEGQTSPAGVTGSVANSTNLPIAQVTATIGGQSATVQYVGSAPGEVEGLLQVNVLVPATLPTGALPVVLNIGGILSQSGVTISVK